MKRIGFIAVIIIAVAVMGGSQVLAGCSPSTRASNFDQQTYAAFSLIDFGGNTSGDASTFTNGRFWATADSANNQGDYTGEQWMNYYGSGYGWFFVIATGKTPDPDCITGCMTVYIEDSATDTYVLWTQDDTPTNNNVFDFTYNEATGGNPAAEGPRPRVDSSGRSGDTINIDYTVPNPTSGVRNGRCTGNVTAVNVYRQASATDPGRDITGWTLVEAFPAAGGSSSVALDCSNIAVDQWLATGLEVEGQPVQFVSNPTQVECDPDLADPNFRIHPNKPNKPGKGPKKLGHGVSK